jgi:ParB family chromosome partitioning protein
MLTREVVSVDPFRCRLWPLHDRLQDQITEASCTAEIQSFGEHGQMIPVLGRSLRGDPQHDVELIYGARRLFAARFVRQPLLVELRELTDRDAIIALDLENRQRQDLSPYERGLSFAGWLRGGHFSSQEEMARALQVSTGHVSRLLKLVRLPSIVVNAFGSGAQIREAWGLELVDALSDPVRRQPVLRAARAITGAASRPPAAEVFGKLLTAGTRQRSAKAASHDLVIKDGAGTPLFRMRRQSSSMVYLLPLDRISAAVLERVEQAITGILAGHGNETPAVRPVSARHLPYFQTQEDKPLIGGDKQHELCRSARIAAP